MFSIIKLKLSLIYMQTKMFWFKCYSQKRESTL